MSSKSKFVQSALAHSSRSKLEDAFADIRDAWEHGATRSGIRAALLEQNIAISDTALKNFLAVRIRRRMIGEQGCRLGEEGAYRAGRHKM
jgi:hypothetical protein